MVMRKLRSRRGMSIIMGLLLLLVCVTAGAAALTSAASNAGRYSHLRRDQQRYLAVASAARLVRDELCAGEYTASASLTETYTRHRSGPDSEGKYHWYTTGPEYTMDQLKSNHYTGGSFGPWLEERLDQLFQAQEVESNWWSLAGRTQPAGPGPLQYTGLSVQVDGEDPLLSQVKWELTMGEGYTLNARFWLEETDKEGKVSTYYATTMAIPAKLTVSEDSSSGSAGRDSWTTVTRTVTVTWPLEGAVVQQD